MSDVCGYCAEHDHELDVPVGPRCGAPATHIIYWLDETGRYSLACAEHLELDDAAPPHVVERRAP